MTAPTSPRGYIDDSLDFDGYGALVDAVLEHVPDLQWPRSIRTFARMRHDPQLTAVRKIYTYLTRKASWALDGKGCRDEVTQTVADDLGLPILSAEDTPTGARRRGFTWAEHLRLSLLDLDYGHMFFEQSWAEQGGRWRLDLVQERMPQTVAGLHLNDDGTLKSVEQEQRANGRGRQPIITTKDHRLVYYVNDREGSNYFGQSLLRPAFGHWLIKDQVQRVHATSIRRFGMGVPSVEAPPGATPAQVLEAQRLAATYKASENAGLGLPHGFTQKLTGLTGSVPDAVAFLNYIDRQMTRMALSSILDMATSENGARALGDTVFDVLLLALQSVADGHAGVGTSQIVIPLVDANWGIDEPAPRVVCSDIAQRRDIGPTELAALITSGGVTRDPGLEAWLRSRLGAPQIVDAYQPKPETTTGGGDGA